MENTEQIQSEPLTENTEQIQLAPETDHVEQTETSPKKEKKSKKDKGKKASKKQQKKNPEQQPEKPKKEKVKVEKENLIKLMFHNPALYYKATELAGDGKKAGYQRLEFLGDRAVGLVVAQMLYQNFPDENEGQLARRFVALVCASTLAKITTSWDLPEFKGKEHKQMRHNKSVLSDVCESVIGALYLDQGIEAVEKFMYPIWTPLMLAYQHAPQDSKSALQELSQKQFGGLPTYKLLSQKGQAHMPEFTVEVSVGEYKQEAKGPSIKKAEQEAAYLILKQIRGEDAE